MINRQIPMYICMDYNKAIARYMETPAVTTVIKGMVSFVLLVN